MLNLIRILFFTCVVICLVINEIHAEIDVGTKLRSGKFTYILEEKSGSGGFGIIYKARRISTQGDTYVALKTVSKRKMKGISGYSLVRRVWDIDLAPPFVRTFPSWEESSIPLEEPDTVILPMEYLPQSLFETIDGLGLQAKDSKGFETNLYDIETLVEQLSIALKLLSEANLAHGDIKPSNIMVQAVKGGSGKFRYLLNDYETITLRNSTSGNYTNDYAAPELETSLHPANTLERDLYASGLVVFQALLGMQRLNPSTEEQDRQRFVSSKAKWAAPHLARLEKEVSERFPQHTERLAQITNFVRASLEESPQIRIMQLKANLPLNPLARYLIEDKPSPYLLPCPTAVGLSYSSGS